MRMVGMMEWLHKTLRAFSGHTHYTSYAYRAVVTASAKVL